MCIRDSTNTSRSLSLRRSYRRSSARRGSSTSRCLGAASAGQLSLSLSLSLARSLGDEAQVPTSPSEPVEHRGRRGAARGGPLAADEFLPIFIYVIVHAELAAPLLTRERLWRLGHPRALQAEPGYYLTMFDAGIEYIRGLDLGDGAAAPARSAAPAN